MEPFDAQREANSALMGGGMVAGVATGATIGVMVAGPVGVVVGATLGAVAGALGAAAAGAMANPEDSNSTHTAPTDTDTVHLHINDSGGGGRPVVLIHGWPLSAQAWAPQVSVLEAAGYRVVAYDRRGFGRSDKPESAYNYDVLADDLQRVMDLCGLQDVTLVGFSMGGGEVARYIARHGESLLRSVVFAAAVPPYLMKTTDNPQGPLKPETAQQMKGALEQDRRAFFEQFTKDFFSANGVLQVTKSQRGDAITLCHQSAQHAALACIDAIVPIEGSGQPTHRAVAHSQLVLIDGAPHGLNVSHAQTFNAALLSFLRT